MRWGLIAILGSWGVVMGLLTSLVGIPPWLEPLLWFGAYAVWIPVILWRRAPAFQTALAASLLSGALVGPVQAALLPYYIARNPWYASMMNPDPTQARMAIVAQGIVAGFIFGLGVSGVAWTAANILDREPPTPS